MKRNSKSASSMLRKKPWNRVDLPVYSIASSDGHQAFNMNICTYATAVSMHPKLFSVAIYKGSKTLEHVFNTREFVLQVMNVKDIGKVRLLGKQSGYKRDKIAALKSAATAKFGFMVLADALAYIHLQINQTIDTGDHFTCICSVVQYKNNIDGEVLMLSDLTAAGIISI